MSRDYRFVTDWDIAAPRDRVWHAVSSGSGQNLTPWWPGVRLSVGAEGLAEGAAALLSVRSPLRYVLHERLALVVVEAPSLLVARSSGDLVGVGRVELMPVGGERTVVRVTWSVTPTRRWMLVTAWLLDPAFRWAHRRVMSRGLRGLRATLEAEAADG